MAPIAAPGFMRRRFSLRWPWPKRSFWVVFFSLLGVLSSLVPQIGGTPKPTAVLSSLFFAAAGALAVAMWPMLQELLLWFALAIFGAAVLLRVITSDVASAISDGLITLAIVYVAAYLCAAPILTVPARLEKLRGWWPRLVLIPVRPSHVVALSLPRAAVAAALTIGILFVIPRGAAQTWSLMGVSTGSPVWNAHVIASNLSVSGRALLDPLIVSSAGNASPVSIPESPVLNALKFLHPGALNGPFVVNLLTLIGLFGLLVAGTRFVDNFCNNCYASAASLLLFATLPLGYNLRFAAPLDLIVPVALCAYVIWQPRQRAVAAAVALLAGFTNVASGYELAIMLLALRIAGYGPGLFTWLLAALGALGSIIFGAAIQGIAPAVSLTQSWWFADELSRIFWTEHVAVAPGWVIFATLLGALGVREMIAERMVRPLTLVGALAGLGILFAVPTHLGGVPIVSPARILQVLPLGWPSARMLELALFASTIPIAFGFRTLVDFIASRKPELLRITPWLAVLWIAWLINPKAVSITIPIEPPNTTMAEFPIAEGGSPIGIGYADELLARGLRIVQPLVFVDGSPLSAGDLAGTGATDDNMRKLGVGIAVVRKDLYASPRLRTVEPQIYDSKAFEIPRLARNTNYKLAQFAGDADVYHLNSR
ncbi:MAG: hypothetical protein DLM50_01960 [Candidatus Meridianibacter frigidus]|nr:MAG: hypothetical protein DLM50_01960 [Candidatus Eremiobacteraeota bacterium]